MSLCTRKWHHIYCLNLRGLEQEQHVGQLQNCGAIVTSEETLAEAACICNKVIN